MRKNKPTDIWKHIDMHGGDESVCWEWQQAPGGGKGRSKQRSYFSLNGRKVQVTHLVWEQTQGTPVPAGHVVRHKCDNSLCCNPKHLEIGTARENTQDMVDRDRHGLPSHVVRRIRVLLSDGRTHQEIANLYGVDRSIVTKINSGTLHDGEHDHPTQEDFDDYYDNKEGGAS